MARTWMGVALLAGWLGVSATALAQLPLPYPPAPPAAAPPAPGAPQPPPAAPQPPPAAPGDGYPGGPGGPGLPPGYPDGNGCPPGFVPPPGECLPDNSFSNIHPEVEARSPRLYFGVDFLYWWVRKRQVPPLVSQGDPQDLVPGAIGQPRSQAVIGPGSLDNSDQFGGRFSALYWFDQEHTFGVDGSLVLLEQRTATRQAGAYGNDPNYYLSRPFYNPNTGMADADPLVVGGIQGGSLVVAMPRRFIGGETNLRVAQDVSALTDIRLTLLAGFRVLALDEKLQISEGVIDYPDVNGVPGNITTVRDNFTTYNRFYGGQVGVEAESRFGPLVLDVTGKLAAGLTTEVIKIGGDTLVTENGGALTLDPTRGFFAQPSNDGSHRRHEFGIVPEVALKLGWEFNEHLTVSLGYDFLYWSRVVRPGDQIDQTVNLGAVGAPTQFGTSPHPLVPFNQTSFWAQGISVNVLLSY